MPFWKYVLIQIHWAPQIMLRFWHQRTHFKWTEPSAIFTKKPCLLLNVEKTKIRVRELPMLKNQYKNPVETLVHRKCSVFQNAFGAFICNLFVCKEESWKRPGLAQILKLAPRLKLVLKQIWKLLNNKILFPNRKSLLKIPNRSWCYKTFFGGNLENLDFPLSQKSKNRPF